MAIHEGAKLRYSVLEEPTPGTCSANPVGFAKKNEKPQIISPDCSYNGCAWAANLSFVAWENNGYIVTSKTDDGFFERLNGWETLSAEERNILKFRNLTGELYFIEPSTNGKARSICEVYGIEPYQERPLIDLPICKDLAADKVASIFRPHESGDARVIIQNRRETTYEPSRMVTLDLDGNGMAENLAPLQFASGAGCGCDYYSIEMLDEERQPLNQKEGFLHSLDTFLKNLRCGEWVDIILLNGEYYLDKRTGNKHVRTQTREIYPLTGARAFQQICSYVNEAPVKWEYRVIEGSR